MDIKKAKTAIDRLKCFEPADEPYYLCYSGGKDSDCIRILAELANVKHEIHHNLTTVDAPETIQYIKSIPNVIIDKATYKDGKIKTMWNLIPFKKMPPLRIMRYCCSELKEQGGKNRLKITGVRMAESKNRADNGGLVKIIGKPKTTQKFLAENDINFQLTNQGGVVLNYDNAGSRRAVEHCFRTTTTMVNPIIDWTEDDVWEFLNYYGCESNPLYKCGRGRIGCIGCPMQSKKGMKRDFKMYPKYYEAYIRAFDRMVKVLKETSNKPIKWSCGEDVMHWWLASDTEQLSFDGFDELDL
jgi:phosphoadenosine phosphosulfate reductase